MGTYVRFGVTAVTSLAVYVAFLYGLTKGIGTSGLVASVVAYGAAALCNYWLHKHYTFQSDASHTHAVPRYIATHVLNAVLNSGAIFVLHDLGGVALIWAQVVGVALLSAASFILYGYWVFAERR